MAQPQTMRQCQENSCTKEFNVIPQELKYYKMKNLPLPDHCPACRHRFRMALRSERKLYRRECGKCNNKIFSVYPTTAPYTIYCHKCFWDDIS